MSAKRTQGLWVLKQGGTILDEDGKAVAVMAASRGALIDADARLIAAAPEMFDALGAAAEALALPTSDAGKEKALAAVRAALVKAEGR